MTGPDTLCPSPPARRPWGLSPDGEEEETRLLFPGRMGSFTTTDVDVALTPCHRNQTCQRSPVPNCWAVWGKDVLTGLLGMKPTAGPSSDSAFIACRPPSLRVSWRADTVWDFLISDGNALLSISPRNTMSWESVSSDSSLFTSRPRRSW